MQLNVRNETSTLKAVVLGQPGSIGKVPTLEETYDAKSYESVLHNKMCIRDRAWEATRYT